MHVYGGITPDNVKHIEFDTLLRLINDADELMQVQGISTRVAQAITG